VKRTDLDLAQRLLEVLRRDASQQLDAQDIALKFDVNPVRVPALLKQYVDRGYLDRKHLGHGAYVYVVGPVTPDVMPRKRLAAGNLPPIDAAALKVKPGLPQAMPNDKDGTSKYDAVFARLTAPETHVEIEVAYVEAVRRQCMTRNKNGGLARFGVRKLANGKAALCRLADAPSEPLRRVA
jgi:hypothetical protein